MSQQTDVVVDKAKSSWSDLWKKEDYWAIWLGLFFCFLALYLHVFSYSAADKEAAIAKVATAKAVMSEEAAKAPFKTIEWYNASDNKKIKVKSGEFAATLKNITKTPQRWKDNPLKAFVLSKEEADAAAAKAKPAAEKAKAAATEALDTATAAQEAAALEGFKNTALNADAEKAISAWRSADKASSTAASKAKVSPYNLFTTLPIIFLVLAVSFSIGIFFMGQSVVGFLVGFVGVFIFTVIALLMDKQFALRQWGFSAEAWAIILGMLIANTVGTPKAIKPALQVEFFIKTGLVLLGAEILLDKIVAIGIPGLFVAWVVTPVVLVTTYIFGQKVIKMPSKTLNITISADMSVCGTSAAIATAAACRAKKEELALAVGLSLLFTAIMMIVLPIVIKALGLPEVLGGAWIGGTIDSTGAVAAAGAFLGDKAMYVAATIKMIQNVLIGLTAFCVAIYWVTKVDRVEGTDVNLMEIWHRFPKFVLGFLAASVIYSYLSGQLGSEMSGALITDGAIKSLTSPLRNWCFTLSFAAIGLATNFRELAHYFKGGKPLILYVCGQSFNLCLTLTMAYIMFYLVFPDITARI